MARRNAHLEAWAMKAVTEELGLHVETHDDGSQPSMYDFRVGPSDDPSIAIEVTGAFHPAYMAQLSRFESDGHRIAADNLRGTWIVTLERTAKISELQGTLPSALAALEAMYGDDCAKDYRWSAADRDRFRALGVRDVYMEAGPRGGVAMFPVGTSGNIDSTGDKLVQWIGEYVAGLADVRQKLAASGAPERHLFVPVGFDAVPWAVESFLADWVRDGGGLDADVPRIAPALPPEITHVWVASIHASTGVRWDGSEWLRFRTSFDEGRPFSG